MCDAKQTHIWKTEVKSELSCEYPYKWEQTNSHKKIHKYGHKQSFHNFWHSVLAGGVLLKHWGTRMWTLRPNGKIHFQMKNLTWQRSYVWNEWHNPAISSSVFLFNMQMTTTPVQLFSYEHWNGWTVWGGGHSPEEKNNRKTWSGKGSFKGALQLRRGESLLLAKLIKIKLFNHCSFTIRQFLNAARQGNEFKRDKPILSEIFC